MKARWQVGIICRRNGVVVELNLILAPTKKEIDAARHKDNL